jgi:hypothetical protein
LSKKKGRIKRDRTEKRVKQEEGPKGETRREEKRGGEERRSRIDAIETCWDGLWTEGRRGEAREDETSEQREHR